MDLVGLVEVSQLNWIERELVLTGQLPRIPDWFFPPLADERFLAKAKKGDRVAQGQKFWIGDEDWCGMSATKRLMVMDYVVWLGTTISVWLEERDEIRWAMDRCPPAASLSYWETKRPD